MFTSVTRIFISSLSDADVNFPIVYYIEFSYQQTVKYTQGKIVYNITSSS